MAKELFMLLSFADAEQIGEAIEIGKYKLIYEKNGKNLL